MKRAVVFVVVGGVLALAGAAFGANSPGTQTVTQHLHGTQTTTSTNPCTGDVIDLSESTNMVMHETFFAPPTDEAWGTFTEEDSFTGIDVGTGVTYSGHDTVWGGFNVNEQNSTQTFTESIHAVGSDGSSVSYHQLDHITLLPDGQVSVSFTNSVMTCTA